MFKNLKDKLALSGITVLLIGISLLIFTFISAYGFLAQELSIIASADLVRTFGEALAPLISACIHIMYLGVMGWIGSLITIRGVTIITHTPKPPTAEAPKPPTPQPQLKPQPQPQKAKIEKPQPQKEKPPEAKPPEPEIVVIPPEEIAPQMLPAPEQQKEPEKNGNASAPPQATNS